MNILQFTAPPLFHYIYGGEDTYATGQKHPNRKNIGVFDMLVVTQGSLFIAEESEHWVVKHGQTLILRPDRHHYAYEGCVQQTHFYWLHFQTAESWLEAPEDEKLTVNQGNPPFNQIHHFHIRLPRICTLVEPLNTYESIRRILQYEQQPTASSQWRQQALFQDVLLGLNAERRESWESSPSRVAEDAAAFLRQHYKTRISYDSLKEHLHFHPTYIARCMMQVFGVTPLDYLTNYRLEQSKLLLMNTDLPIGMIALDVGFSSATYYIRCFAQAERTTPRSYRKQFRV